MDDEFFRHLAGDGKVRGDIEYRDQRAAQAIYDGLFYEQKCVIDDPYRFKSLITPRRSGKTWCAIAYGVKTCLEKPGAVVVIVTLTLKSAKRLYWDPILKISDDFGLNLRRPGGVHHTNAEARFENGSKLFLVGAETKSEIEKLRGGSYDLVIIDECKSFTEHIFHELVWEILTPALSDREGTLIIIGTPGALLAGPFYEATMEGHQTEVGDDYAREMRYVSRNYLDPGEHWKDIDYEPQWSRHHWTQGANKKTAGDLWQDSLVHKSRKGWSDENPTWLREYLGKWISTGDTMVYAYARILTEDAGKEGPARCVYLRGSGADFNRWGLHRDGGWRYVLGMDLGYEDDLAIVVVAYSPYENTAYLVYEFKQAHMIISQVAEKLKFIEDAFEGQIEAMVADTGSGGKQLVESLNQMYGTHFVRAEKQNKPDYVELLNSDLWDGKFKILADGELADEWKKLQWDLSSRTKKQLVREGRLKEDPACDNHLADATLYTWRYCLHHFSSSRVKEPEARSPEWYDKQDYEDACAAAEARDRRAQHGEFEGMDEDEDLDEWMIDEDLSWLS